MLKEKRCAKCNAVKLLSEFHKDKAKKDGHQSWCQECRSLARQQYMKIHGEEVKNRNKRYRDEHKKELAAYDRKYYAENKEKELNRIHKYHAANPEKLRANVARRYERKMNLPDTLTEQEWQNILEKHFHCCHYCGCSGKLEEDHVIPVSKGGGRTKENIVPSCQKCNSEKSASDYGDFVKRSRIRLEPELF